MSVEDLDNIVDNSNEPVTNETQQPPMADPSSPPEGSTDGSPADAPADGQGALNEHASEAATRRSQAPAGNKPPNSGNPISSQDPAKALNDLKAQYGREKSQYQRELDELRSFQTQARTQDRERQAQAEKLKLKRWDTSHPEHGSFRSVLAKRDALSQQIRSIDKRTDLQPEVKEALKQELTDTALSRDEQTELQDHYRMSQDFMANPVGSAREVARSEAQQLITQAFEQFQSWNRANSEVGTDLKELPPEAAKIMSGLLSEGNGYDVSLRLAKAEAELATLRSGHGDAQRMNSHAQEQARLQKSNATINRDPRPSVVTPDRIYAEAKKRALAEQIGTAHPKFPKIYSKVEAEMMGS